MAKITTSNTLSLASDVGLALFETIADNVSMVEIMQLAQGYKDSTSNSAFNALGTNIFIDSLSDTALKTSFTLDGDDIGITLSGKDLTNKSTGTITKDSGTYKGLNDNGSWSATYTSPLKLASLSDGVTIGSLTDTNAEAKVSFSGARVYGGDGILTSQTTKSYSSTDTYYDKTVFSVKSSAGVSVDANGVSGIFESLKYARTSTDTTHYTGTYSDSKVNAYAIFKEMFIASATSADMDTWDYYSNHFSSAFTEILLAGDDKITGTAGSDTLYGGTGIDTISGKKGSDYFVFAAGDSAIDTTGKQLDTVTDFKASEGDEIIFSGLSAITLVTGTQTNDTQMFYDVDAAMSNGANVVFQSLQKSGYLFVDFNGDALYDSLIKLSGVISISANDMYAAA